MFIMNTFTLLPKWISHSFIIHNLTSYLMILISLLAMSIANAQHSGKVVHQEGKPQIPKEKETILGLYVTAKESFDMWKANPEQIKILDVRTPEEYIFIGHADMAWNIPLAFQSYDWDSEKNQFKFTPNPDFLSGVQAIAGLKDTLMVMCRSGGRSALAVNALAKAGYTNVYQITDGMEGDTVSEPESVYHGRRLKNGWKNSGLPWTYELIAGRVILPKG